MAPELIELFEAYRLDKLPPEDKKALQERFDAEPALREEFSMFTMMVTAIEEKRREELKHFIRSNTNIRALRKPFYKTYFFYSAAAASLVLCILSYFLVVKKLQNTEPETASNTDKKENTLIVPPQNNNEPVAAQKDSTDRNVVAEDVKPKSKQVETVQDVGNALAENADEGLKGDASNGKEANPAMTSKAGMPDEVEVTGDKMVLDTFMNIARKIYIAKPKAYQTSADDQYAVVTTGDVRALEVQFWVSPVNYNGYKLSSKLLVIYGKEDLKSATFQELNNLLYMKYRNEFFVLRPNEVFTQFAKVADAKTIADLEAKQKK